MFKLLNLSNIKAWMLVKLLNRLMVELKLKPEAGHGKQPLPKINLKPLSCLLLEGINIHD